MNADPGAAGGTPRALLLATGLALLILALLYNELFLAPLARESFAASTRVKIRAVQLGFGATGLLLLAASEGVRRSPRLARRLARRTPATLMLLLTGLLPIVLVDFGLRPFVSPKTTLFAADRELGWRMRPGAEGEWGGSRVRINQRGLRGPLVAPEKPEGTRRVLFLGDSVTFGFGIEQTDDVFPFRVGRALERALGTRVEVVNAGVGGWSPWQQLAFLQREGLDYQPDLMVIGFVLNDVTEKLALVRYGGTHEGWQLARTARGALDRWLSMSALATVAREGAAVLRFGSDVRLGAQAVETADVRRLVLEPDSFTRAWRITLENLARMVELARRRDVPSLLLIFPYAFQLEAPAATATPQRRLIAFARSRELPVLDLLPVLSELGQAAFLDPSHLSRAGHARVAEATAQHILAGRWLGTPLAAWRCSRW
jgi:lysophospholipase L1-like esterase